MFKIDGSCYIEGPAGGVKMAMLFGLCSSANVGNLPHLKIAIDHSENTVAGVQDMFPK